MLRTAIILAFAVHTVSSGSSFPSAPENITVTFISPSSVRVSWQQNYDVDFSVNYNVTYRPTSSSATSREIAGDSDAITLVDLLPATQYTLYVSAYWNGQKYRSRSIIFRTLGNVEDNAFLPKSSPQQDMPMDNNASRLFPPPNSHSKESNYSSNMIRELPTIRGVEVGIVVLVLFVWAGAIALFFNRWGKIRMLLPYQPDYKQEQLKVPGTGVCANGGVCNGHSHHQQVHGVHWTNTQTENITERCQRARINSAIFVSSEGRGFDSIEFIRRYGSQSVLCRKAKSAENLPMSNQNRRFSENPSNRIWESEEPHISPLEERIELVDIHNEQSTSSKTSNSTKKMPLKLPTLSVSGPSRNHSPTSPTDEETGKFL